MRFLVLCPYLPDVLDHGGRIRTRVLLTALQSLGEVELAVPEDTGDLASAATALGLAVHGLPAGPGSPSPVRKLAAWARGRSELFTRRWGGDAAAAVDRLLARGFDAVVVDSSHTLPVLPEALKVPLVVHFHNVESALLERSGDVRRGLGERVARSMEARQVARLEAAAARRAALCLTTSELDRQRLADLVPEASIHAVENSVDLEALPQLAAPVLDPVRLLLVGSFDYPPNREAADELVLRHLPELRRAFPGLALDLVGRDDGGHVRALAQLHGCSAPGRVADLLPYYREASACYVPIRSGGGTRIKVLEAFALGRPVLATAVAVEGLGVEPGRHYWRVESPEDGVAALRSLASGHGVEVVARARDLVAERWSHERARSRIAALVGAAIRPTTP